MINTKFNIPDLENFALNLFKGVCDVTKLTNFPKSLKDNEKSVMVVSVSSSIKDFNAYGRCLLSVEIFVKEKANGLKDNAKMKSLLSAFVTKVNAYTTGTSDYIMTSNEDLCFSDYDSQKGFHVMVNYLTILIKQ